MTRKSPMENVLTRLMVPLHHDSRGLLGLDAGAVDSLEWQRRRGAEDERVDWRGRFLFSTSTPAD
jgi:hypothetical protein